MAQGSRAGAEMSMATRLQCSKPFSAGAPMRRQDPSHRRHLRMLRYLQPPAFNEKKGIVMPNRTSLPRSCAAAAAAFLVLIASHVARAEDSVAPVHPAAREIAQEERNRALLVNIYDAGVQPARSQDWQAPCSRRITFSTIRMCPPGPRRSSASLPNTSSMPPMPVRPSCAVRPTAISASFCMFTRPATRKTRGSAIVDIFRVEHGKIAEHWDVIQPVPEQSANDNTMF